MNLVRFSAVSIFISLGGCAAPTSYAIIDGQRTRFADPNIADVVIVDIDGEMQLDFPTEKQIAPGPHFIHVASRRLGRNTIRESLPYVFKAKPCTRHKVLADHHSAFDPSKWDLIVGEEPIPACKIEHEN